jgi:predicted kinase
MTVYLVAGPPAVGKSTVTRLLAGSRSRCVLIDVDRIRDQMVVTGRVLPGPDWSPELVGQLAAARESACGIARAYDRIGFDVVMDDFYDPFSHLAEYDVLTDLRVQRILLLPSADVARERNRARGAGGDFIDGGIDHVYRTMPAAEELAAAGWTIVDTSDLTAEQARDRVHGLLHP